LYAFTTVHGVKTDSTKNWNYCFIWSPT